MSKTDYLLPGSGKSRRSSNGFASFGIRASALDFPMEGLCGSGTVSNDLHKRLKERYQNYEEYELEWKRKIERAIKKREEKKRREQEEKENEIEKENERKEKEEQEKESKKNLISNDFSSPIVELNFQELVEEIPKEASSNNFTSLKRKAIDIFPSAPLYIQPTFITQIHVNNDEKSNDCVVENTKASQKLFVNDLLLCKKKNLHDLFERKLSSLKQIWILSSWEEDACLKRRIQELSFGVCSHEENTSLMLMERIKSEFLQIVFDPGG